MGQGLDQFVNLRGLGSLDDIGQAGAHPPIADVVSDAVVEQGGVLRNHPDGPSQAAHAHTADVLPVDHDATLTDLVQTQQQPGQCRLA